jgi:uncharacterized protein (TIGR03067 family)
MKVLLFTVVSILQVVFASGAEQGVAPKEEIRGHQGIWKPIAAVLGGAKLPQPALDAITLKLTGVNYEVTVEGEGPDRGTCILDTNTTPKRMTITSTNGPNNGKTFLAIYEMKDDRSLRVCYDLSGAEFPKDFKALPGTKLYLVDYRRQTGPPSAVPGNK